METLTGCVLADINRVDFFTTPKDCISITKKPKTRQVPRPHGWKNLSTHFPGTGKANPNLKGAPVKIFRGISNPMGGKSPPGTGPEGSSLGKT